VIYIESQQLIRHIEGAVPKTSPNSYNRVGASPTNSRQFDHVEPVFLVLEYFLVEREDFSHQSVFPSG
jgi:hypothetical protein